MADNITLGRGKLYFAQFLPNTQTPKGERYLGNTPGFTVSVDTQSVKHYNSDQGVKVLDREVVLQTEYKGGLTTDNISSENLALFFFGAADTLTVAAAAAQTENIVDVEQGLHYQVGVNAARPSGVRKIASVVVKVGVTVKTINVDYTVDLELARVYIVPGGGIANADDITVEYDLQASSRSRIISGSTPIEGALRYISDNPEGTDRDAFFPWVKLIPNGDYALKSDDFQAIQFNLAVQKLGDYAHAYLDGRPV